MKKLIYEIKKHITIYGLFMKNSLIGLMEYRANLYATLTMELVYLASKILYSFVIYQVGVQIDGISPDETMLFIATFIIMTGIYTGLFMNNFYGIPQHIRTGSLDMYIIKPISLQFIVTMRRINFVKPVPNLTAGFIMLFIAASRLHIEMNFYNVAGYLLMLISATCITYAVFLTPQILTFWTVKTDAIWEVADKCWDFNNMPMNIYNKWMQRIGVFIIPIFFITNLPAMFLGGRLNSLYITWSIVAPILFLTLVRILWSFAIRNYSSASS